MAGPTLITGAGGLVGTWVRHWWDDADGPLVVVDHHDTDLLEPGAAETVVRRVAPSRVVHLAWSASGTTGYRLSDHNEQWLRATLELVRAAQAVSAVTWVTGTTLDVGEPTGDTDAYTAAKRELRLRLRDAVAAGALGWLRPFYVFDEDRGRPEVLAATLAARDVDAPVVLRSPDVVHDFVHASDVGAGIVAAVRARLLGEVELGSGAARSVADLVTALGWTWVPAETPTTGAPAGSDANADTAPLRDLGWTPERTDGLFGPVADAEGPTGLPHAASGGRSR